MFAQKFYKKFKDAKNKKIISNYRVFISKTKGCQIGVTNEEIAGVYNPITLSSEISGDCLVQWQNGLISSANLDDETLYRFEKFLRELKLLSYKDPAMANFLPSQKYPNVKLYDKNVDDIVEGKEKILLDLVLKLKKWQDRIKTKVKEISAYAINIENVVFTSKGLFESEKSTLCGYASSYEDTIVLEDSLRKVPKKDKIDEKRRFIEQFYSELTKSRKVKPKDKKMLCLLAPWVSKDIFYHFIISNLDGSLVYNKQSCFSINNFKNKKQILRRDLSLRYNPTIDFDIGSYKFTGEGVDSQPTDFIKNGKLETPILDLKYAKLQKSKPTAIFSSQAIPLLKSGKEISFEKCFNMINEGIMVFNVLGLHTQSPVSGDYSLPSPQVLYVKDGKIIGRTRAIIVGNLFKDMNQENFQIINFATEKFPGFLLKTNVSFESVK